MTSAHSPLVIAHRGASGYRPEHTLASYRLAIEMGADFIEPDLVSTKDGALVARHEPNIAATTDVARRPEFAARRRTAVIDGIEETGWFSVDFTLAELRTLRAVQPRSYRSPAFDGQFPIPTLEEIITLAQQQSQQTGRTIGVYPETKHPAWHCEQDLALEPRLLAALRAAGWESRSDPVFIQSFESGNLRWLRSQTGVRLVQLVEGGDPKTALAPAQDRPRAPQHCQLYARGTVPHDFAVAASFAQIADCADAIGPWKRQIVVSSAGEGGDPNEARHHAAEVTRFIALAHAAGLEVHTWTFRDEPMHLLADYGGDPLSEYRQFFELGVDGVFTDFPDTAVRARAEWQMQPSR